MPAGQTIEGGAQVRVTGQGFAKLTAILPGVLSSAFTNGFSIAGGTAIGFVSYCGGSSGSCHINVALNSITTNVTTNQTLHFNVDASASTSVPLDFDITSCTMTISVDHLTADGDLAFGIDATTGELTIHLNAINNFSFTGSHFNGCSILSDIADVVTDILNSAVGQFVIGLLTPVLDNLVQSLLPNPLGIAGELNVGQLLAGVSPGTTAEMEARIVPGGYVSLVNSGMSLGIITGLNSDSDPTTRQPGLDSEPALCVPPIPVTDYGAPPFSLPLSPRNTFELADAGAFSGAMDPAADLAMGISKTTLNLAGHHLVTSGALCLGVGTSVISELNVGTIGILVPSLSQLDPTGKAPLLLVTRPQRAITFEVGDNTASSPALTIGVSHMEVDFYAFIYERYVRAFTMDLSLNAGLNLDFEQQAGSGAVIKPSLSGISANAVTITVLNSEFVKETPAALEAVLPSVFSLVTPLIGNLPDIAVPSFAGFSLNNLTIQKVTTSQDDFLALTASLGTSSTLRALMNPNDKFAQAAIEKIDGPIQQLAPSVPSIGTARLVSVATPTPDIVIAGLSGAKGGQLPTITFDVDTVDAQGRALEWSWNVNGGLWRSYASGPTLSISDPAFAWQGKYEIGLKSRANGDYHTVHYADVVPVDIDSVDPTVDTTNITFDGDVMNVPIHDIVSEGNLVFAWGRAGEDKPVTAFAAGETASISAALARDLATADGQLALHVRDEAGNTAIAIIESPFHGTANAAGCASCDAGAAPSTGGLLLIGLVGAIVLVPRRRRLAHALRALRRSQGGRVVIGLAAWASLSTALSLSPGCSCHKTATETSCETGSDCPADACMAGQLPFCIDGTCVCSDDVPAGRIGPYSAVAVGSGNDIWVSAYSETYGDLVVTQAPGGRIDDTAWEWVDGVPSGVTPEVPGSMIRGGITDPGVDVGMYTSIQVAPGDIPMVTYFDVDNASLKFAAKVNGTWQIHVVDPGSGSGTLAGSGDSNVGMYTSLTLRSDDGRPGVAYLAHVADADGSVHAEVRFAAAQIPVPTQQSDWQTWVVDTGAVPPAGSDDPYPLPGGLGLFVDVSRDPTTQAPVVAYYDRANGELKMSKFDPTTGEFATPVVLAGTADDAGWSPSVAVDTMGVVHVAYVDATQDDLDIVTDQANATPLVIDDGYRIVGQTVDGLPKPTFDFVGDDAKLLATPSGDYVSYQDATTQELLLAHQGSGGTWTHESIAGATMPWPGAYGFFASGALAPDGSIVMSSWVIDQPNGENWVEVFRHNPIIE